MSHWVFTSSLIGSVCLSEMSVSHWVSTCVCSVAVVHKCNQLIHFQGCGVGRKRGVKTEKKSGTGRMR